MVACIPAYHSELLTVTCEDSETDEVARALPPDVPAAGQDDDAGEGDTPAGIHQPGVILHVTGGEERRGG